MFPVDWNFIFDELGEKNVQPSNFLEKKTTWNRETDDDKIIIKLI